MPGNRSTVLTNSSTPRGMKTWTSAAGSTPRAGRSTSPRKQNFSTKAATAQRHWARRISFARITATNYDTRASISDRWAEQRFARRLRRGWSGEAAGHERKRRGAREDRFELLRGGKGNRAHVQHRQELGNRG